jgi:hypothetical protein
MKRLSNTDLESPWLRLLLYGIPGSTKTRTAATAALDERTSPALALVAAGNPVSLLDYAEMPDLIEMEKLIDYNDPYNWLLAGQPKEHPFCKNFNLRPPYKSVILDSITETQRMSFAVVTGNSNLGPGSIPTQVERQHFGKVLAQMVRLASMYYQLPLHVIMTSLERTEKDEMTGAVTVGPLLWGQSSVEVAGYAHIVGRLVHRARLDNKTQKEVGEANRLGIVEDAITDDTVSVALFRPSGKYAAKWQAGKGVPYMMNPTIAKILDCIESGRTTK